MSLIPPLFNDYFPSYYKETYCCVDVLWYQTDFSQSKYPPEQKTSEACTLICLLVAYRIAQQDLLIRNIDGFSPLNILIAESILEGNRVHPLIVEKVQNKYLNVEEALQYGGTKLTSIKEWKFEVFCENLKSSLFKNIKKFLCQWYNDPKDSNLFMLLITCKRTILIAFQQETKKAILFDSHGHNTKNSSRGLVVAQAPIARLEELCHWYVKDVVYNCYQEDPDQYELTFLYYNQRQKKSENCNHKCLCSKQN